MHELKEALCDAQLKLPKNLEQLLEEMDTDGSGVIDYTEFLAATFDKKVVHQESTAWNAFQALRKDSGCARNCLLFPQVIMHIGWPSGPLTAFKRR